MVSEVRARRMARDRRTMEELLAVACDGSDEEARWEAVATLQCRGTEAELDLATELARHGEVAMRVLAADVLGQLGWDDCALLEASVAVLTELLGDARVEVVAAAAVALGHRGDPRAIGDLLPLVGHPDAGVRRGVVHGLSGHDDPRAVAALITLSRDEDDGIRDWATFGLGQQTDVDTPALRAALRQRLGDPDDDVRFEAREGLGRRGPKPPPRLLDGAEVHWWAWAGDAPFGELPGAPEGDREVFGLAVCRYAADDRWYRFSCNAAWEVVQDWDHETEGDAKAAIPTNYDAARVVWVRYPR